MYIVTHSGSSHQDERTAISLLLAHFGYMDIYRRQPTEDELKDSNVFVIDIGNRYESVLHNFDHHQLSRDTKPECALSLLIKSKIFGEKITKALLDQPWLKAITMVDSKGYDYYNNYHSLAAFPYDLFEGPAELGLQALFEEKFSNSSFDQTKPISKNVTIFLEIHGKNLISYCLKEQEQFEKLKYNYLNNIIKIINKDKQLQQIIGFQSAITDRQVIMRFLERNNYKCDFFIYKSSRNNGWRITRTSDQSSLDFYKVNSYLNVEFVHKTGFTLQTSENIDIPGCIELIKASII